MIGVLKGELTGGCLCGAVTYRLKEGVRLPPYACHCTDCQKRTGSAFSEHMLFAQADIEIDGSLNEGTVTQPSGAISRIIGCDKCMSRIYAISTRREGFAALRCGSLDNSNEVELAAHFWVGSKQPWIVLPDDLPQLETQPETSEGWVAVLTGVE